MNIEHFKTHHAQFVGFLMEEILHQNEILVKIEDALCVYMYTEISPYRTGAGFLPSCFF